MINPGGEAGFWVISAIEKNYNTETGDATARGSAILQDTRMIFKADEIEYNENTGLVKARGNVFFRHYQRNEELHCDRMEYNVDDEAGKFYNVWGEVTPRIDARPGVLTSSNPLHFEGQWAERIENRYILYKGWVTNCKMPKPWWTLRGPKFEIVTGEHAIARNSVFRVRKLPLFFTPYFYKSLEKAPRKSGFLMPNIGNSSRYGKMIGVGYYWAIKRSYDAEYRLIDYTSRGYAHHLDFRGKPNSRTDFDATFYGVQDRGYQVDGGDPVKQGGANLVINGKSDLGNGWYARGQLNYLTSLTFRQAFSESFNEAIGSEVHSSGFVKKSWDNNSLNFIFQRIENFQSTEPGDSVVIRKLPEVELNSRDRQYFSHLPVWVSLESSIGLMRRTQPLFQTRAFMERADFMPRISTAFSLFGFRFTPSVGIRETHYGSSQTDSGRIAGSDYNRSAREATVDLMAPSIERIFDKKSFLGDKVKHVVETRATYRYVTGIQDFNRIIRFDETDLMSNTNEVEFSVTNRLYSKRGDDVQEILSWQLWQKRFFDPTFGGAVVAGRRNVVESESELTAFTFLDRPRGTSPIVSALKMRPLPPLGIEWRTDYDPMRHAIVNSSFTADYRFAKYFISAGHEQITCIPSAPVSDIICSDPATAKITAPSNQFRGSLGFGDQNHRGWNAAFVGIYDYRAASFLYETTQVTYNTDCCGLSVQFRRFGIGAARTEFRIAFAIANIGTFGTLKKQERLF